jgi:hypothetical protein
MTSLVSSAFGAYQWIEVIQEDDYMVDEEIPGSKYLK